MKTIYVLARTLSTGTKALHRALEDHSSGDEDFFAFRFIATADQVRGLPGSQPFLVVRGWKDRPDAEEILKALKENHWQVITLKELFLG